jgi:hypothetical protein
MDQEPSPYVNRPIAPHKPVKIPKAGLHLPTGLVLLIVGVYVLLLAASTMLAYNSQQGRVDDLQKQVAAQKAGDESNLIDKTTYQAVFLSSGQVYFAKIRSYTASYVKISDIYYLQGGDKDLQAPNSATSAVSLVKLGCELHGPKDEMIINRDQLLFWENLTDTGQVAQGIKNFQHGNPTGQKCV